MYPPDRSYHHEVLAKVMSISIGYYLNIIKSSLATYLNINKGEAILIKTNFD